MDDQTDNLNHEVHDSDENGGPASPAAVDSEPAPAKEEADREESENPVETTAAERDQKNYSLLRGIRNHLRAEIVQHLEDQSSIAYCISILASLEAEDMERARKVLVLREEEANLKLDSIRQAFWPQLHELLPEYVVHDKFYLGDQDDIPGPEVLRATAVRSLVEQTYCTQAYLEFSLSLTVFCCQSVYRKIHAYNIGPQRVAFVGLLDRDLRNLAIMLSPKNRHRLRDTD